MTFKKWKEIRTNKKIEYLFSYIKHVDVLIRQRQWFNSLDFKRLRFKNPAIVILCGNELTFIMLKSVFSSLNTRYTDFFLTIFSYECCYKRNFPKLPYLIVRYSIFWLVLISFYFFKCHLRNFWIDWMTFYWIIILFIGLFFYENISFCMIIFLFFYNMFPLQRTGKILVYIIQM